MKPSLDLRRPSKHKRPPIRIKPLSRRKSSFYRRAIIPISTRLGRVHPKLKFMLRKFEKGFLQQIQKDLESAKGFIVGVDKLKGQDLHDMNLALANGDFGKVNEIAERNGFKDGVSSMQDVLYDIYTRAEAGGIDVGFIGNYFPRQVKDLSRLYESLGVEQQGAIEKAYSAYAKKTGVRVEDLSSEEKTILVNKVLNTNSTAIKTKPNNIKARTIDALTHSNLENYHDPVSALINYIESMNESIGMKGLFGTDDKLGIKGAFIDSEKRNEDIVRVWLSSTN